MKFEFNNTNTGIVITDPQNDFLSPDGKGYYLTKGVIDKNNTVLNLERLLNTAQKNGYTIFVSPHYLYPHDKKWKYKGKEQDMLLTNEVYQKEDNNSPTPDGSDFVQSLKKYILHEDSVICTPHNVAGPESNDLVYQLRQHGLDRVFLAGVLSNVCVESHMRSLIENGFQTAVVYDATAATSKDDFNAAMTNYKAFATLVCTTDQAIAEM